MQVRRGGCDSNVHREEVAAAPLLLFFYVSVTGRKQQGRRNTLTWPQGKEEEKQLRQKGDRKKNKPRLLLASYSFLLETCH